MRRVRLGAVTRQLPAGVESAQHKGSSSVRISGRSVGVGGVCPDVFVCLSGAAGSHDDPDCILETCLKHSLM